MSKTGAGDSKLGNFPPGVPIRGVDREYLGGMQDTPGWSTEQLVAHAHDHGFAAVSARRLETWRNQGLLPHPDRIGQDGTRPLWRSPEGTQDRMLALCRLTADVSDPAQVRARLWLAGCATTEEEARSALHDCLDSIEALFETVVAKEIAKSSRRDRQMTTRQDALRSIARQAVALRGKRRLLPLLVKGNLDARADAVYTLLELVLTGDVPTNASDLSMSIDRALGVLPRARIDRPRELHGQKPHMLGPAWHDGTPIDLAYLASVMSLPALHEAVLSATTDDLELARRITGPLVRGLFWFQRISSTVYDDANFFGLGLLGLGRQRKPGEFGPVYMTCAILALLDSDNRTNLLAVHQAVTEVSAATRELVTRLVNMPAAEFARRTERGDRRAVTKAKRLRRAFAEDQTTSAQRS